MCMYIYIYILNMFKTSSEDFAKTEDIATNFGAKDPAGNTLYIYIYIYICREREIDK